MSQNRQAKFLELRQRYSTFFYHSYRLWQEDGYLCMQFHFSIDDEIRFQPVAKIELKHFMRRSVNLQQCHQLAFHIGMAELVSYWKCACPKQVKVLCGSLSEGQIAFWKKLYWNGLGEFFYTNGISTSEEEFVSISCADVLSEQPITVGSFEHVQSLLVPIGGGKDSVVSLELLRQGGRPVVPLIMNPRGATRECVRVAGFAMDEVCVILRSIDPYLLELNGQGFLNGHTPFSAMLAFYTLMASLLTGIPSIALSNENSANESTVVGTSVNHQYSKSIEFEDDFRAYVNDLFRFDAEPISYFSFLRPLSELHISKLFSTICSPYFSVFRSCNVGSKQDIWCCHCAKCLFAYIILSPFIEPKVLIQIFGNNLLDDLSLQTEFGQLCGYADTKPFECVGTVDEVHTALALALQRFYPTQRPALLKDYTPQQPNADLFALASRHNLPSDIHQILLTACSEKPY